MFVILFTYCALLIDIVLLPSAVDSNSESDSALCRQRKLLRLCNDGV